jgi:phosphate transport system permease protein
MPEESGRTLRYVASATGSDERGDGTLERPFRSLERATAAVLAYYRDEATGRLRTLTGTHAIELVCAEDPARRRAISKRRCFNYHVDPEVIGADGNGSETAPWSDLETALAGIVRAHGDHGSLRLTPGEWVRLSVHGLFAAGAIERRKQLVERVVFGVLALVTTLLVLPLAAILAYLLVKAWPVLSSDFILQNPTAYMTAGGIWAPLVGTFYLVFISLAIAAPIGVLAGVYLNEYAGENWLTRIVNLAVVNLAGVPSIVHALFGVGAFVLFAGLGRSVLAASCTLAIMTLPVIVTSTKEALAAVPYAFREACWNMGASRWQTIRTIVLPNAISGILTGVILQVSRAAGETAPILFTGAVFYVAVPDEGLASFLPYGLRDRCMALSYHLFTISTQVTGVSEGLQYGTAVVLIGLVMTVNLISIAFRVYLRSHKKW